MSNAFDDIFAVVSSRRRHWLVTGSAGFIGSHLIETLLSAGQQVTSIDDFSTGHRTNLEIVRARVGEAAWSHHRFIEASVADAAACADACAGVDVVLHEAALGSVPRSIETPLATHTANATGFLTMLIAAQAAKVSRFVYAASSSTYGDSPTLPKVEPVIGRPLSPYAVTKYLNELYADVFGRCYGFKSIGLRYFNVFGPRQDPHGAYAAVIPRWARAMVTGERCIVNGDGETSRDFCYVENVVQANLRAALVDNEAALNQVYNVAFGERTTLNELHGEMAAALTALLPELQIESPQHAVSRTGDIQHSLADISKARALLGFEPTHSVRAGLARAMAWYL